MPREKHPPKVKHATRPRPFKLPPLSDLDRNEKAQAALLAAGGVGRLGDVPNSHEHVAEHYLKLVTGAPEPLGSTGDALDRARAMREVADYDLYRNVDVSEAAAVVAQARIMLDAIRQKWGFPA